MASRSRVGAVFRLHVVAYNLIRLAKPIHLSAAGSRVDADALCTERP